ncbi:MAG TPA: LEPR-XLL domain-containing protein, partial [Nitrospira sp.]|nr:LEPR-XLL domain-containing protein [Candidatus Manganitrophaceae bacterium]
MEINGTEKRLELEALEPRLLLSADGFDTSVLSPQDSDPSIADSTLESIFQEDAQDAVAQQLEVELEYDAFNQVEDIFDGLDGEDLNTDNATPISAPLPVNQPDQDSDAGNSDPAQTEDSDPLEPTFSNDFTPVIEDPESPDALDAEDEDSITDQMVETLNVANAPPAENTAFDGLSSESLLFPTLTDGSAQSTGSSFASSSLPDFASYDPTTNTLSLNLDGSANLSFYDGTLRIGNDSIEGINSLNDLIITQSDPKDSLDISGDITLSGRLVIDAGDVKLKEADISAGEGIFVTSSTDTILTSSYLDSDAGEIQLLGNRVGLTDDTSIDTSGEYGGGTILIGGDYQGSNPDIQNAEYTYVGQDVSINADAILDGDGGTVIVWSEELTRFYGSITAQGGVRYGDGGFAEVSGKATLGFLGDIDLSAPQGSVGTLLLDPTDVTISITSPTDTYPNIADDTGSATVIETGDGPSGGTTAVTIDPSTFPVANIEIHATNTITVAANGGFDISSGGNTLFLDAGTNISILANITAATITLTAGGSINGTGLVTAATIDLNAVSGIGNTTAL